MPTTWVTFAPCFLWIFLGAPFIERLRDNRILTAALSAISAAVVGVILNLAVWFGMHVVFDEVRTLNGIDPLDIEVPVLASIEVAAAVLVVAAAVAVFRFRIGPVPVLAGCAIAGLLMRASRLLQQAWPGKFDGSVSPGSKAPGHAAGAKHAGIKTASMGSNRPAAAPGATVRIWLRAL